MSQSHLPTREEMFANARREFDKAASALEGAVAWLRSDWRPLGSELTDEQATLRTDMHKAISTAARAIEDVRYR